MKKLLIAIPLFGLFLTTGCHAFHDDDDNPNCTLPAQVQDFVANNYPGLPVEDCELEDICDSLKAYEVELENGSGPDIDLYFDLNWNFLFEETDIPNSALPAAVTAAIQAQYPGYTIEPGNSERFDFPDGSVQYKVDLESPTGPELDVVLRADGSFVCTDTSHDDGDDDDNNTPTNIPANVLDFINSNYPGYQAQDADNEDICNDVTVYEVELEHGPGPDIDLYFGLNWNFLFAATDIPNSALPTAVTATIQAQYPGYSIEPGNSERYDFSDGSLQYKVDLEKNNDDDVELVLSADGVVVCSEWD